MQYTRLSGRAAGKTYRSQLLTELVPATTQNTVLVLYSRNVPYKAENGEIRPNPDLYTRGDRRVPTKHNRHPCFSSRATNKVCQLGEDSLVGIQGLFVHERNMQAYAYIHL